MEGFAYPVPPDFAVPPVGRFPGSGDGYADYYGMVQPSGDYPEAFGETSRKPQLEHRTRAHARSRSRSRTQSRSRSRSRSKSRTRSKSRSLTEMTPVRTLRKPSFLDAFRVLYITPSKHSKSTEKYLSTKVQQDHIQNMLKSDGLGSKRWLFYPRSQVSMTSRTQSEPKSDHRIKIEADFFRKYKRSKKIDSDAPITKLKSWELVLYKKLGFLQPI